MSEKKRMIVFLALFLSRSRSHWHPKRIPLEFPSHQSWLSVSPPHPPITLLFPLIQVGTLRLPDCVLNLSSEPSRSINSGIPGQKSHARHVGFVCIVQTSFKSSRRLDLSSFITFSFAHLIRRGAMGMTGWLSHGECCIVPSKDQGG